jgi:hypothetical protein
VRTLETAGLDRRKNLFNGVIARKPAEQKGILPDHDTLSSLLAFER